MPATIDLAGAEVHLLSRTGREHVLAQALQPVLDDYDAVLIDCPPSLGVLTINGLTAAEAVIVPLQCEALSHRGVGQLLETIEDVRQFANEKLRVLGVIPTMFDAARPTPARCCPRSRSATGCRCSSRPSRSRCASPRRRASGSPCCSTHRRRRERWPTGRSRQLALRRHAERLTWRRRGGDRAPDPLGKRALFWVPVRRAEAGLAELGDRLRPCPIGKHALYSGAPPEPDSLAHRTSGNPLDRAGQPSRVECQRCRQSPAVGMLDLLIFQFPLGIWLPRGPLRPPHDLPRRAASGPGAASHCAEAEPSFRARRRRPAGPALASPATAVVAGWTVGRRRVRARATSAIRARTARAARSPLIRL